MSSDWVFGSPARLDGDALAAGAGRGTILAGGAIRQMAAGVAAGGSTPMADERAAPGRRAPEAELFKPGRA